MWGPCFCLLNVNKLRCSNAPLSTAKSFKVMCSFSVICKLSYPPTIWRDFFGQTTTTHTLGWAQNRYIAELNLLYQVYTGRNLNVVTAYCWVFVWIYFYVRCLWRHSQMSDSGFLGEFFSFMMKKPSAERTSTAWAWWNNCRADLPPLPVFPVLTGVSFYSGCHGDRDFFQPHNKPVSVFTSKPSF